MGKSTATTAIAERTLEFARACWGLGEDRDCDLASNRSDRGQRDDYEQQQKARAGK